MNSFLSFLLFAEQRIRGRLGTLLIFTMSLGILLGYILGDVMDFSTIPLCLLMITNIFLAGSIAIHDSPIYLLRKSRFTVRSWKQINFCHISFLFLQQRAESALKFYRGFGRDKRSMNIKLKHEYDYLTCIIKIQNCDDSKGKITLRDFCKLE